MVDIIQQYDPEADRWFEAFKLPAALGGVRACTLSVLPNFANERLSSGASTSGISSGASTSMEVDHAG